MKRLVLTTLSLLLLAVASHAEVAGERPVSEPAYGVAPGQRNYAAAASDGHNFLVAWIDVQRNRGSVLNNVYASRMNAEGEALDPLDIRLPSSQQAHFTIYRVDTVFLGENYLVYWLESSPASPGWLAVMGARISRDGVLLDATPRLLADRASTVNAHGAASNGNRTVIAAGNQLIVLDREGNIVKPIDPSGLTTSDVSIAMVSSNGHDFLVTWQRGREIRATRLDQTGAPAASLPVATAPGVGYAVLDLASDNDGYVAVLESDGGIVAQHLNASGEPLEKWPLPLQHASVQHKFPGFVFSGGSYLLMDCDTQQNTIGVRRLGQSGQPAGDYVPAVSAPCYGTTGTLAFNGAGVGMFWTEGDYWAESFHGAVMAGQSLAIAKTSEFAHSAKKQTNPDVATAGRNSAVVWNESDGLYAGRITIGGQMLDGRGIRVSGPSSTPPRIVYDGTNYLIGWTELSSAATTVVKLARLAPDSGVLLDPSGLLVASSSCSVGGMALSPNVTSTLVAWSECNRIVATVAGSDSALGTPSAISTADPTHGAGRLSASWNGSEWLVAWQELVPRSTGPLDEYPVVDTVINASRVTSSLIVLDPRPISISNSGNAGVPLVASDGHGFLVAWSRSESTPPYNSVMAQRISSDGSLLAQANGVRLAPGNTKSLVWDGAQYAVAFAAFFDDGQGLPSYTLSITHVAATGSIEGFLPLAVVTDVIEPDASLIVTATGQTNAVYTRLGSEAQYGDVERAFVALPHGLRGRAVR